METIEMIRLWVLAFMAMFAHYFINFSKRDYKSTFDIEYWIKENWFKLAASILSIIVLFMMFVTKKGLEQLDLYLEETSASWIIIFYKELIAASIGFFNTYLIEKLASKAKKKIDEETE